jgi:alpha-beta hydrolase superfamily lysophospholipase
MSQMITCIFFFGGYQATITDMMKWQGSAATQTSDDVYVFTYAWPAGASAGARSAISKFNKAGTFDKAVSSITSSGADRIVIVGHSSGCAIANAVDHALADHDKVSLVALDGFAPDRAQLARPGTQVWAAECNGVESRNHASLKGVVGSRLKIYKATGCRSSWALHFSLVNAAASDASVKSIATGYVNCRANLMWL